MTSTTKQSSGASTAPDIVTESFLNQGQKPDINWHTINLPHCRDGHTGMGGCGLLSDSNSWRTGIHKQSSAAQHRQRLQEPTLPLHSQQAN